MRPDCDAPTENGPEGKDPEEVEPGGGRCRAGAAAAGLHCGAEGRHQAGALFRAQRREREHSSSVEVCTCAFVLCATALLVSHRVLCAQAMGRINVKTPPWARNLSDEDFQAMMGKLRS